MRLRLSSRRSRMAGTWSRSPQAVSGCCRPPGTAIRAWSANPKVTRQRRGASKLSTSPPPGCAGSTDPNRPIWSPEWSRQGRIPKADLDLRPDGPSMPTPTGADREYSMRQHADVEAEPAVGGSSLWSVTAPAFTSGSTAHGHLSTDVAVIGAGVAGLSTALHLRQRGIDTLVLE